jgi:hypothetical protein
MAKRYVSVGEAGSNNSFDATRGSAAFIITSRGVVLRAARAGALISALGGLGSLAREPAAPLP